MGSTFRSLPRRAARLFSENAQYNFKFESITSFHSPRRVRHRGPRDGVGEAVEGQLVHVSGAVTRAVEDDQPYGFKVYIDDGSGEVQVFVHIVGAEPVVDVASLLVDQPIEVTGLAAQYEDTYEIAPREAADLSTAAQ
jgi:hypothetical protein